MGLFDFFKPKQNNENVPTLRDGTPKTYDYFAFKLHDINVEELSKMEPGLFTDKNVDVSVKLEIIDSEEKLVAYHNRTIIGYADKTAIRKYKEHKSQKLKIHSRSIGKEKGSLPYCRIRMIYFY